MRKVYIQSCSSTSIVGLIPSRHLWKISLAQILVNLVSLSSIPIISEANDVIPIVILLSLFVNVNKREATAHHHEIDVKL